jgi:serine/threonine-protein phosphatase 5
MFLFQIAFQKAISVEEKKISIVDSLSLDGMDVEDKYDGPRLTEDNRVSVGFVQHLMQHYKAQKKLHRRFAFQVRMLYFRLTFSV